METRVVNIRYEECDVRIDRTTIWGNPFRIGRHGTREEVIEKYRFYVRCNKFLLSQIHTLRGKRLGCWCKPLPCHGDILKELADAKVEMEKGTSG